MFQFVLCMCELHILVQWFSLKCQWADTYTVLLHVFIAGKFLKFHDFLLIKQLGVVNLSRLTKCDKISVENFL